MKNFSGYFNSLTAQETHFYKSLSWDLKCYTWQQFIRGVNTVIDNNFIKVKNDIASLTHRETSREKSQ